MVLLEPGQAEHLDQIAHFLCGLFCRQLAQLRTEHHVFFHRQPRQHVAGLKNHADLRRRPFDRLVVDQHFAFVVRHQTGDDTQQSALAAAAGAEDGDEFPFADRQRDVFERVDGVLAGIAFQYIAYADGTGFVHGFVCRYGLQVSERHCLSHRYTAFPRHHTRRDTTSTIQYRKVASTVITKIAANIRSVLALAVASVIRWPRPSSEPMNSPTMAPITASGMEILIPSMKLGSAAGTCKRQKVSQREAPSARKCSSRLAAMPDKLPSVAITTGKKANRKVAAILEAKP